MLSLYTVQSQANARQCLLLLLSAWLLACTLFLPAVPQAQPSGTSTARELSNAFRSVARQAVPAPNRSPP